MLCFHCSKESWVKQYITGNTTSKWSVTRESQLCPSALMLAGSAKSKKDTQVSWVYCGFWEHPTMSFRARCLMRWVQGLLWKPEGLFARFQFTFLFVKGSAFFLLLLTRTLAHSQSPGSFIHSPKFYQRDKQTSFGEVRLDTCLNNGQAMSVWGDPKRGAYSVWPGQGRGGQQSRKDSQRRWYVGWTQHITAPSS